MERMQLIRKYYPEVKTVVDATKHVRVDVISDDCVKGTKKAPNKCAMARAFQRKNYNGAIISKAVSYLIKGTKAIRYRTPPSVAREIVSFDRHQDFQPGRYSLSPPPVVHPTENKRVYRKRTRPEGGEPSGYKNHVTAGVRSLFM
jgi:hypothetical protein